MFFYSCLAEKDTRQSGLHIPPGETSYLANTLEIGQKIKTLVIKKNLEYEFFNLFILAMIY